MKLICAFLLFSVFQLQARSVAQTVTIEKKEMAFVDVLREIKKQTGYTIICSSAIITDMPASDMHLKNTPLRQALDILLRPQHLSYYVEGKSIVVRRAKNEPEEKKVYEAQQAFEVRGRIFNTAEPPVPLSNVSISLKGGAALGSTDEDGYYIVKVPAEGTLVFTALGYHSREVFVNKNESNLSISLRENVADLEEVVVVGMTEMQKKHIASSVASLDVQSNIEGKPITSLSQSLQTGNTTL